MRKDTRIGVAIGLVLFAVLIAYAVVGNKTSSSKKKVTLDTIGKAAARTDDTSVAGGAPSGSAAGEGKEASAPQGNVPAPLVGVETADPSAAPNNSGANWAALLSATEKFDAVRTKTPDMEKRVISDPITSAKGGTSGGIDVVSKPYIGGSVTDTTGSAHNTSHNATANATHKVETGETFVSIARAVYGDGKYASEIAKANPNIDPRRLRPGTTLQLPDKAQVLSGSTTASPKATVALAKIPAVTPGKEYAVQADDSLYKISVKVYGKGDKVDAIYELNKQTIGPDSGRLRPGMVLKLPQGAAVTTVSSAVH